MSSPKDRACLLTIGYIKENYNDAIPEDICHLVKLFYDKYFYWKVQKDEMKQFLAATNGEFLRSKSTFKVGDIEFECTLYPNGWNAIDIGFVDILVLVKDMPSTIEYFTVSGEIGCHLSSVNAKFLRRWTKIGSGWGFTVHKLMDCKDLKDIEFHCVLDILGIKYKDDADKSDYKMAINVSKSAEYEWKIDQLQMEQLKNMHQGMSVCSDNFGNNNLCISFRPNGFRSDGKYNGKLAINVICVRIPFDISAMDVKYSIQFGTRSEWETHEVTDVKNKLVFHNQRRSTIIGNRMSIECPDIDINELFDEEWIAITVSVEIMNIYDNQDRMISTQRWEEFGIE